MLKQIGRAFLAAGWLDTPPRPLTPDDVGSFFKAAEKPKPPVKDAAWVRKQLSVRNPVRWARLQRDYRWMQKSMKKMGLNPEEARYIF